MGFSLVAATAIVGVAVLISLELIVGTTIPTITEVHNSFDEMKDRAIDQIQTSINISDHRTKPNASLHDINIEITNEGSTTLKLADFTVLINGTLKSFTSTTSYLYPKNSAEIVVLALTNGNNKVKVVTGNGISDYYEYTYP